MLLLKRRKLFLSRKVLIFLLFNHEGVMEWIYDKVSMTPRSALSDEMLQLVENGEKGYFSNAFIRITKENL